MHIDRGDFFFNAICQLTEAVFSNPSMIKVYETRTFSGKPDSFFHLLRVSSYVPEDLLSTCKTGKCNKSIMTEIFLHLSM